MRVAFGSAFRNSAGGQAQRFLAQVAAFAAEYPVAVRVIAVEGDSTDRTREVLLTEAAARGLAMELRTANHGGPVYGSTEAPERMRDLSRVGNEILAGVVEEDDFLVYVESDLGWSPETIGDLIVLAGRGSLAENGEAVPADIVAPLVFSGRSFFYDTWAFRGLDGGRFSPFAPYHNSLAPSGLTEVASVGSCLVMRSAVARAARMNGLALVSFCDDARRLGYRIYASADHKVQHP